jgi:ElaB/YqjD/DUF883 family membrane-anchored ribosome-binding protein
MGERPDQVRRDPLDRGDPLGEGVRGPVPGETGFDPATDAFDPDAATRNPLADPTPATEEGRTTIGPDPALGGGVGGGATVEEGDEIERTRADIERTRADMSETVDAIQERLSPENLKEQAKDRVMEATVGRAQDAGSGIVGTIRQNPLPAALTGIGLGWLLMSARKGGSSGQTSYQDRAYGYPPSYEQQRGSTGGGTSAGQAVGRARDRVGESATQAQDRATQAASQAQDRANQVASRAQERVGQLGNQARRASGGFQRMLQENPLAMGALGVGVGAAVGLAVPQTSQEHEVMGEARDTLVEKAQEKAQDAQQRVQRVAEEAQSAAREEADNQNLTGGQQ